MKQDKELLLKDLCARLPYGVKMNHIADDEHCPKILIGVAKDMITLEGLGGYEYIDVEHYKPYLFPLSSMTEEQKEEMSSFDPFQTEETKTLGQWAFHLVDFYNKHHFDYRGLIEKGIALDATGLGVY